MPVTGFGCHVVHSFMDKFRGIALSMLERNLIPQEIL